MFAMVVSHQAMLTEQVCVWSKSKAIYRLVDMIAEHTSERKATGDYLVDLFNKTDLAFHF